MYQHAGVRDAPRGCCGGVQAAAAVLRVGVGDARGCRKVRENCLSVPRAGLGDALAR